MAKYINNILNRISLKTKITFSMLSVMLIIFASSIFGILKIHEESTDLLYQSSEANITNICNRISDNISIINSLTGMMIESTSMQEMLSIVNDSTQNTDESDNAALSTAFRTLMYIVPEYYRNYKYAGIKYIDLITSRYTVHSDASKSQSVPNEIQEELLEQAHERSGYTVLNTKYCNEYGLFLCRDICRAENLKLDVIGTVIICIDLDEILSDSRPGKTGIQSSLFALYENDAEIYHSKSLSELGETEANLDIQNQLYGVTNINKHSYFFAKQTLEYPDFVCLYFVEYDNITKAQRLYLVNSILILVLSCVFGLLITKYVIVNINRPISDLMDKMHAFGNGEDSLYVPMSEEYCNRLDEIGELHRQFDQMAAQVQELIQRNYISELLKKDAQLKFLESQINPHFLYNTLESINWRAKSIGAEKISVMVESLGSLLRVILGSNKIPSTLGGELEIARSYMTIIKIRHEDRIRYEVDVPDALIDISVPRLILQPLLENAINYALEDIAEDCLIKVTAKQENNNIIIEVSNTGSQFEDNLLERLANGEKKPHGFGIGLLNIDERIKLKFGQEYGISLYNADDFETAVVRVTIPYISEANTND